MLVPERESSACYGLLEDDPEMLVWATTSVEVLSAIHRMSRTGDLQPGAAALAIEQLEVLRAGWSEVLDVEIVRTRAERLLAVHDLRAADALQLAAALTASGERTRGVGFVGLDKRLNEAARREGFRVLPD
jgi:hypothetical protein